MCSLGVRRNVFGSSVKKVSVGVNYVFSVGARNVFNRERACVQKI
jgi:hypothetical protein